MLEVLRVTDIDSIGHKKMVSSQLGSLTDLHLTLGVFTLTFSSRCFLSTNALKGLGSKRFLTQSLPSGNILCNRRTGCVGRRETDQQNERMNKPE